MATFFASAADAGETSEALRGLAHASRGVVEPAQMYGGCPYVVCQATVGSWWVGWGL